MSEVDSHVVHRRSAARIIATRLNQRREPGSGNDDKPSTPLALEELSRFVDSFLRAVDSFLHTDGSAAAIDDIVTAVVSLELMTSRHRETPEHRPHLTLHRATTSALEHLAQLWPMYEKALTATTMGEAQELGKNAQAILDSSVSALSQRSKLADAVFAMEDLSVPDVLDRTLVVLAQISPNSSLLQLGEQGAVQARALTGLDVDEGHGAHFLLLRSMADVHLDPVRFATVVVDATKMCHNSPMLRTVAKEPEALETLARSTRAMFEAFTAFEAILQHITDEDALFRRVIKFYGEVYEDVAVPLFAWYNLLSGQKAQPFTKLLRTNSTDLARSIHRSSQVGHFFIGTQPYMRNAAQHGISFDIRDDHVYFRLNSFNEVVSKPQVINDIFGFLESLAATSWALSNELSQAGVEIPTSQKDADFMGMSGFKTTKMGLSQMGIDVIAAEETDDAWAFSIATDYGDVFLLALAIFQTERTQVRRVSIWSVPGIDSLHVDMASVTSYLESVKDNPAEEHHLMAMLELRKACRVNGVPVLNTSDLDYAIACLGIFLLESKVHLARHLRVIMAHAVAIGYDDGVALAREILSVFRISHPTAVFAMRLRLTNLLSASDAPETPQSTSITISRA